MALLAGEWLENAVALRLVAALREALEGGVIELLEEAVAQALLMELGVTLCEGLGVSEALTHPERESRAERVALALKEDTALALSEEVAQAESRALGLGLAEERADAALLALGALPLGRALPLAALVALTVPGGPLEGVKVGALREASGEVVAPSGGGEAVAAPALGTRGEGEGAEEVLAAALAVRRALRLAEGEEVPEGKRALAAALSDCLALALAQELALERPVAQMPFSPLTSSGQPEALLCSEAVAAPLPECVLLADCVATRGLVAAAAADSEAEREAETVALSEELDVKLALPELLSLPLPLVEAEPVPHWVALALAVSVAEGELTRLLEAPDEALPVARTEADPVNVLGAEPVWEGLGVAVLLLRSPLPVGVLLLLGAGETLGMVEPVTKPSRLIPPVGLGVADALSQELPLLRGVKEAETVSEGDVEGLEE